MRVALYLIAVALVCGASSSGARANVLSSLTEKAGNLVESVKEKVTGEEATTVQPGEQAETAAEQEGDAEKKKSEGTYEGGLAQQIAHSVLDATADRLGEYAKENSPNALLKPVISMAVSQMKKKGHEKINQLDDKPAEEAEKAEQAEEGEKKERRKREVAASEPAGQEQPEAGKHRMLGKLRGMLTRGTGKGVLSKLFNRKSAQAKTTTAAPASADEPAEAAEATEASAATDAPAAPETTAAPAEEPASVSADTEPSAATEGATAEQATEEPAKEGEQKAN